jgi:1-acyl-sn-glycerol-3-phosphate acyltransferase
VKVPPYHWWRTIFFLIPAVSLYTIVLGTASLVSTFFDRDGDSGHTCARAWAWLILKTTGVRVRAIGLENLDAAQSYVVAANHQSIYDIPIVFATLPLQLRIVAKASLRRIPFLGWHLQRTGHLLVDRQNPGAGILKRMAHLVRAHRSLIVFPEGTRSTDGSVARFKGGIFLLAIDSSLPVLPVSIARSRYVMMKGRIMVCPDEVTVTVHKPISTTGITRDRAREFAEEVRAVVRRGADEPLPPRVAAQPRAV